MRATDFYTPRRTCRFAIAFAGAALAAFSLSSCGTDGSDSGGLSAAIVAVPREGTVPLTVSFDATDSRAEDGEAIVSYVWDFGDGAQGSGALADHTYVSAGIFEVRLVVTDTRAASREARTAIAVTAAQGAPTAVIAASAYAGMGSLAVAFDGSGSRDSEGSIVSYTWTFGDGGTSSAVAPNHVFSPGVYTVTLTVRDDSGATGQDATVVAVASYDDEVVRLVNVERNREGGLPPLKGEPHLAAAALRHSTDMAVNMVTYIDHVGTDGSTFDQRIREAGYTGYTYLAENIAAGFTTPASVMAGWMDSSGHRANILNPNLREIGASYVLGSSGYRHFWTQDFGARGGVYPVVVNREAFTTATATVDLYIYGSGWATEMQVSNSPDFAGAVWEPHSSTKTWTLASGLGTKTVYVKLRRGATEVVSSDTIVCVE
ncbi:MAG: PKD domain-containing protein [Planctomycetota bacterium]